MTQTHKNLLAFATIALLITVGLHFYVLGPRIGRNKELATANKKIVDELLNRDKTWKLDQTYFGELKGQYEAIRNDRRQGLDRVLDRANGEFKKLIDPTNYGQTVKQWRDGLFVLSFGESYYNTMNTLKGLDINTHEAIFGMTPDQVVRQNEVYRKLAHLYVVRESAILARKNGLTLTHPEMTADWCKETETKNEFTTQPAMIMVKPVRSFFVEGDKEPYLDEFPVELRVRGRLGNVSKFISSLTADDRFLPVDRIVVRAVGAKNYVRSVQYAKRGAENMVEARLTISGFLVHRDVKSLSREMLKIEVLKPARRGA